MDAQRYQDVDVRAMLLDLGVGRYVADMAIPKTWFLVGTTDPDDATVIEIVKGLQRGLRELGFKNVLESGVIDKETAHALNQVSGPGWVHKSWIQVMSDVLNGLHNPQQRALEMRMDRSVRSTRGRTSLGSSFGSYFEYEGLPPGPLPGYRWWSGVHVTPPGPLGDVSPMDIIAAPLGPVSHLAKKEAEPNFWERLVGNVTGAATKAPTDKGITLNYGPGRSNPNNMAPADPSTKAHFKYVQRQINRLGKSGRISEDGVIGSGTLAALKKTGVPAATIFATNTATIARNAITIGRILSDVADSRGIPPNANMGSPGGPAEQPQRVLNKIEADKLSTKVKSVLPWILLAGGVAAGAVYFRRRGKKGKRS